MKYSLFKLLCNLVRLCEVTLLQKLWINLFGINIPLSSSLTISIYQFLLSGQQNKGKGAQRPYEHTPLPNRPTPATSCLTDLALISFQVKRAPCYFTLPHATRWMFSLCFAESFLCAPTLFFLHYFQYWGLKGIQEENVENDITMYESNEDQ